MRPGWIYRLAAVAATVALAGLIVAACGNSGEATGAAARATRAAAASVEPTAAPQETARAASPSAAPEAEPISTPDAAAAGGPGNRTGGPGFLGGRFGGAGLIDAVVAAVAEAAEKPVDEVQALQESGMALAEIIKAEGVEREAVVDQVVDQILANFPGAQGGQTGGARPGGAGAGGGGFGAGGGFDPGAALRNAVNVLIDGETPAPAGGAGRVGGFAQVIVDIVAERTGRDGAEVRELRAGGQSFASLLFMAGQDLDAAIDAIVEALQTNAAAAARPEGAPTPPSGEGLRAAIEAIMFATDDSEAEPAPSPAQAP